MSIDYEELIFFLGELQNIAESYKSRALIWVLISAMSSPLANKSVIIDKFCNFLAENETRILAKDATIFETNEIQIMRHIREMWTQLCEDNKRVVWEWMFHFLDLSKHKQDELPVPG